MKMLRWISVAVVAGAAVAAQASELFQTPRGFWTVDSLTASSPYGLDIGHFLGGDGYPDVVVANFGDSSVSVLQNLGVDSLTGQWLGLGTAVRYPVARPPYDVELADLDGDADLDVVVTLPAPSRSQPGQISILRNDGSGSFTVESPIAVSSIRVQGLSIADFDNDGEVDIALAGDKGPGNMYYPQAEILFGPTPYSTRVELPLPDELAVTGYEIIPGYFRKGTPGRLDLAMSLSSTLKVFVALNDGNRTFSVHTVEGVQSYGLASDRFRTGVLLYDLVTATYDPSPGSAWVYWGAINAQFDLQEEDEYQLGAGTLGLRDPYGVATGPIDSGTTVDIVVACLHGDSAPDGGVAVFRGVGDGIFIEPPLNFEVDEPGYQPKPCFVKVADMDADGFSDIVTSNTVSHRVGVLISALTVIGD